MLQTYTFTGAGRQIDAKARFFRYESGGAGGADTSIGVRADGNDLGRYLPGDEITLPMDAKRWEIAPVSAACAGIVRLGIGSVRSSRVAGSVEVIDGGKARSLANIAGVGNVTSGASVGNFSYAQLWNPAGSGWRLIVKSILAGSSTAGELAIRTHNAALATLQGQPVSKLDQNILAGTELRDGTNAALIGQGFLRFFASANSTVSIRLEEPLVLNPGFGVMATGFLVNRDVSGLFELFREPL